MARNNFTSGMQAMFGLHSFLEKAQYTDEARQKAIELERHMRTAKPSGELGDSRLATMDDVIAAGLLDTRGLPLGSFQGRAVFYNGDEPLMTLQRVRSGKGIHFLQPCLAHVRDRTLIVVDPKDAELAWSTARHRQNIGTTCVFLNPFGLHGEEFPNTKLNPLQWVIDVVAQGGEIDTEALEIAYILVPKPQKNGENDWVKSGAIRLIALLIEYLAVFDRDNCTPGTLWGLVNDDQDGLDQLFAMMTTCGVEGVEKRAKALRATYETAPKQWEAIKDEVINAVAVYERGKTLDRSTSGNGIDLRRLKHEPHTVYLMVPADKLAVAATWISLVLSYLIETLQKEPGPLTCTFLLDEFAQLAPSASYIKMLQLYAGKGLQPWFFGQGRFSFQKWPPEVIKEIEDQSLMTMKNVQEPSLLRDIILWSGNKTILTRGHNHGGGVVESASASLGETKRPLLQAEDIMGLGDKIILKLPKAPHLFLIDPLPYFKVSPWRDQLRDVRDLHKGTQDG